MWLPISGFLFRTMTELAKDLELVVPPGVLALLLAVRVLVLCCCTAPPRQVRLPARRQRLRVLVALALGLGCSFANVLNQRSEAPSDTLGAV